MAMLTTGSWPGISQPTHYASAGLHFGRIWCPGRMFQLNEGLERRMIQRYSRPGRVEARGLHAFLFSPREGCKRRGVRSYVVGYQRRGRGGLPQFKERQSSERGEWSAEKNGRGWAAPDLAEDFCAVGDSRGPRCRLRVRWRRGSHARLPGLGRERGQLLPDEGAARRGTRLR